LCWFKFSNARSSTRTSASIVTSTLTLAEVTVKDTASNPTPATLATASLYCVSLNVEMSASIMTEKCRDLTTGLVGDDSGSQYPTPKPIPTPADITISDININLARRCVPLPSSFGSRAETVVVSNSE